jgi:hypothetical protein
MNRLTLAVFAVAWGISGVTRACAQGLPATPCDWDRCALRFEVPWIVAGTEGARVGRVGLLRSPNLTAYVSAEDSALAHALRFERRDRTGQTLAAAGVVLGAAAFVSGLVGGNEWVPTGLGISAFVIGFSSGAILGGSRRELERAIWWYNRSLPR